MTSPFVRRRRLAVELRTLREERGLTADQVSQLIHQSRMKISRLENAHARPDLAEVIKILDVLEVTGDKWNQVVRIACGAAEKGWWDSYGDTMAPRQRFYADIEFGATSIRGYNQSLAPGLMQTPEYTMALVDLDKTDGPLSYQPERMAEARLQRQKAALRSDGPALEYILEEFVARRVIVPRDVMRDQLRHMVTMTSTNTRVTLRVLPVDVSIPGILPAKTAFNIYAFTDPYVPPMAVADTPNTDVVHTEPDEVARRYIRLYENLLAASLPPEDSLALLTAAADRLEDEGNSPL